MSSPANHPTSWALCDAFHEIHAGELRDDLAIGRALAAMVRVLDAEDVWLRLAPSFRARPEGRAGSNPLPEERRAMEELRTIRERVFAAPLLDGDQLIGLLTVLSPSSDAGDVIDAVAGQLARAARNRTLRASAAEDALDFRRRFTASSELTAVTLRYEGSAAIASTLAAIIDAPVEIHPATGAVRPGPERVPLEVVQRADGTPGHEISVTSGSDMLGTIVVATDRALTHAERHTIRHAAVVAAPVLLHEAAAREAQWRVRGGLLEDLVTASGALEPDLVARAREHRVDAASVAPILALEPADGAAEPERLLQLVRARSAVLAGQPIGEILAFERSGGVIISVGHAAAEGREAAFAAALQRGLAESGVGVRGGMSRPSADPALAHDEALTCLAIARARDDDPPIVDPAHLGPLTVLLDSEDLGHAVTYVQELLGPVRRADAGTRVPLLDTLIAYVEAGGNRRALAEREYLHKSTLKYRLQQVAKAVGEPLDDPAVQLRLRTAVWMLRILEARGLDPLGRGRRA